MVLLSLLKARVGSEGQVVVTHSGVEFLGDCCLQEKPEVLGENAVDFILFSVVLAEGGGSERVTVST